MDVLVYVQHLSGVGHFVRMHELGRALAERHATTLVDGGRVVPRPAGGPELLALPRLERVDDRVVPIDRSRAPGDVMRERAERLAAYVDRRRPAVIVVEHYPLSKWELSDEIDGLIDHARAVTPGLRVIASLRDIPPQTRHDQPRHEVGDAHSYEAIVMAKLARFDAIVVHGENALTPLADHVPFAERLPLPVHYTGYVGERLTPSAASVIEMRGRIGAPYVLVSVGGGASDLDARVVRAWQQLRRMPRWAAHRLVLCGDLATAAQGERGVPDRDDGTIVRLGYRADFLTWLASADVSLSHAGYNTCMNLVAARARAVLVPHRRMSDQAARAALFERLGLATTLPPEADADAIARAIDAALASDRPTPVLALDGAARASALIAALAQRS